jgi:cytochrome c
MEFLKDIALPQSAEHIQLLHYMLILILFLFIPFISAIFGGTVLSVFYKKQEKIDLDESNRKFSQDIIELVTVNKSVGFILGLLPILTAIIIFSQLFQSSENSNLIYLGISFILFVIAFNFVYDYRNSFRYIDGVDLNSGKIAIVFLFFALWFFSAGISVAVFNDHWQPEGIISSLFSPIVIIRFLFLLVSAFAITGGAILFGIFYLDDGKRNYSEDYSSFVRKKVVKVTFIFTAILPLLLFANLIIIPGSSLSGAVFAYIIIGLFLLFLAYHFLYVIFFRFSSKFTALLFFSLLFMVLTIIISDQLVISNSTKVSSAILAVQYDEILADLKGEGGPIELDGKEIYEIRCASCHKFDKKLVGPPHNEVVPKYIGKEKELIAYIKNPTKIDPNFPPMPNPGLKPNEVKAVADYVLEQVKKNVEK